MVRTFAQSLRVVTPASQSFGARYNRACWACKSSLSPFFPRIPTSLSSWIADEPIVRSSALDTDSNSDHAGELICHKAFPIEPLGFWPLPGYGFEEAQVEEAKRRFKDSYFKGDKGIWYHGD